MFFPYVTILFTSSDAPKSGQYCPQTYLLDRKLSRAIDKPFFLSIHQSLEANWRRGHYTVTSVQAGSPVWCLQCNDDMIVTGHEDSTIKVGSCCIICVCVCVS